uniref:Conserved hypothetical plastid protein n=1 Tax=Caulacanthus okamurae TaxID=152008 RepID=A0A6H1U7T6_9FLOR|nr:conserved hypothetical plastid protein [Caulacanthus okamurae]QIZ74725.1 conserved hypothetical plastid protein [Caulacanthus okamurae]
MEYINNLSTANNDKTNELSLETPIGWSSLCFDQTIDYYIECNSTNSIDIKNIENNE